jgi:hypothetical protein
MTTIFISCLSFVCSVEGELLRADHVHMDVVQDGREKRRSVCHAARIPRPGSVRIGQDASLGASRRAGLRYSTRCATGEVALLLRGEQGAGKTTVLDYAIAAARAFRLVGPSFGKLVR